MFQLFGADADRHRWVEPHCGHWCGTGRWLSQWWQRLALMLVEGVIVIAALALGDPAALVHSSAGRNRGG